MKNLRFHLRSALKASVLSITLAAMPSIARADTDGLLTIIKMGDLHGHLEPHGVIYENNGLGNTVTPNSGGAAKLYTLISQIRAQTPGKNLLLNCGDTFHGGAEVLFTRGRAVDDIMNYFQIDAFTPGNWDFGYGQVTFRRRFSGIDSNGNPFPAGAVNGVAFPVARSPVIRWSPSIFITGRVPHLPSLGNRCFRPM